MAKELSEEQQQQVVTKFKRLRAEMDDLYKKVAEVDSDRSEHDLVIKHLNRLDGNRRCWSQVGGVLIEKTVSTVLPTVEENRDRLIKVVETINDKIQSNEKELSELQKKYNIREVSSISGAQGGAGAPPSTAT